ncbi:hypothetical protein Zm00014a_013045 [Zea mays]|uniref:Uncharacterized protein n=1 Tax=Zea mays TaxID=4577 RepID=A0A3L6E1B4_MAIZE|nr:hypothetical protein Zm00014a_013045 [Zea mays]
MAAKFQHQRLLSNLQSWTTSCCIIFQLPKGKRCWWQKVLGIKLKNRYRETSTSRQYHSQFSNQST